jgi:hypothetical protein
MSIVEYILYLICRFIIYLRTKIVSLSFVTFEMLFLYILNKFLNKMNNQMLQDKINTDNLMWRERVHATVLGSTAPSH